MKRLNTTVHTGFKTFYSLLLAMIFTTTLISCDGIDVVGTDSGGGRGGPNGESIKTGSRPILSINPIIALEGEEAIFEVRLSKAVEENISVSYSTGTVSSSFIFSKLRQLSDEDLHILSEKPATSSNDYDNPTSSDDPTGSGNLTFVAGETVKTISVSLNEDAVDNEGIESFSLKVRLNNGDELSNAGTVVEGVGYIVDKDVTTSPDPKIYFPAQVAGTESRGSVKVPFVIYPALAKSARLNYATTSVDSSVSATVNFDYSPVADGVKNLAAGQTNGELSIRLLNDGVHEGDEQFSINIFSSLVQLDQEVSASTDVIANSISIPVTIRDDEEQPYLIIDSKSVAETNSTRVVATVRLSWASERDISIDYQTVNLTAIAGEDYLAIPSTTLNFPSSSSTSTKNISTVLLSDNQKEDNEEFLLRFSSPQNVSLRDVATGDVVVRQDKKVIIEDQSSVAEVNLVSSSIRVNEGGGAQKIFVSLNKASATDQVIEYNLVDYGPNPATALDYSIDASSSVTIPAGQLTASIAITFIADADSVDEKTQLRLGQITGGATLGSVNYSIITISGTSQASVSVHAEDRELDDVDESVGTQAIRIALSAAASDVVRVYYKILAGTASSADYSDAGSGSLSISAGTTTASISLNIIDDVKDEENETFSVVITNVVGAVRDASNFVSDITITDDDDPVLVEFSAANGQAPEADSIEFISLTVPASEKNINLEYTLTGTAVENTDYIDLSRGSVFIPAGQTTARINLQIREENTYEPDETIIVTLTGPSENLGALKTHTVTIKESSAKPKISFESATTTVVESAGTLKIPVVLNRPSSEEVTVTYTISNTDLIPAADEANSGDAGDYSFTASSLTIAAGATKTFISVSIVSDEESELNEKFKVTLASPTGASLGTQKNIITTIYDDDGVPEVSLSAANYEGDEGDVAGIEISINLDGVTKREIRLNYTLVGGITNPASLSDYTAPSGFVNIPVGASSAIINLQTTADSLDEEDETLTLMLTSVENGTLGAQRAATVTITNDDNPPSIRFGSFAAVSVAEGSPARIPVNLSTVSGKEVTVNYTLVGSGANPTSNTDYTDLAAGSVTIPAGTVSQNIIINTTNDRLDEENEELTVTLTAPENATLGAPNTKLVTIQDNDVAPVVSADNPTTSCVEGDAGNTACNISISLNGTSSNDVVVSYTLVAGSAVLTDFSDAASNDVTIVAGAMSANIIVNIAGDTLDEGDETFTVNVNSATNAMVHVSNRVSLVTIVDNDSSEVSVGSVRCTEGDNVCEVPVSLSPASARAVTVNYVLAPGTATLNDDYTDATSRSVTIPPGETMANISVTIVDDTLDENDETFTVTLILASSGASIATGAGAVSTVTIDGSDTPPVLSVSSLTKTCAETGVCIIPVSLSTASAKAVTVNYDLVAGTAILTDDYTDAAAAAASGSVMIAAGSTMANIRVNIVDDTLDENNETFTVTLTAPTNANASLGTNKTSTVTITDGDAAPVLSVSAPTKTCVEGDTGPTICEIPVRLSTVSAKAVTVNYDLAEDTATLTDDFSDAASDSVTIPAGSITANIRVNIAGDIDDEVNETFTVTLTPTTNATVGSNNITTASITDDDVPEVGFDLIEKTVAEGVAGTPTTIATFRVDLSTSIYLNDVVVSYTVTSDTALGGGVDYTSSNGSLTFVADNFETQKYITVTINRDDVEEPDETFKVNLHKGPRELFFNIKAGKSVHTATITD